jgi:hypothetical protein
MDLDANDQAVTHREPDNLLRFYAGNGKLDPIIDHISLPAGWSCPGAHECLARAVETPDGWRIEDGPDSRLRCYAASEEARYAGVRESRRHNLDLLRRAAAGHSTPQSQAEAMAALILDSLPVRRRAFDLGVDGRSYKSIVRLHVAGDFFSLPYLDAWCLVCRHRPDILAYAYTKSLSYWVRRLDVMPDNLILTASEGGRHDHLLGLHGLRSARVVFSRDEAARLGLEIDTDDSLAMRRGPSFALLLHGPQPKGTPAAKAVALLRAGGQHGHGRLAARQRREEARRLALPLVG